MLLKVIIHIKKTTFLLLCMTIFSCNSKVKTNKETNVKETLSAAEKEANLNTVPQGIRNSPLFSLEVVEPTKLFDNIYFVGYVGVGAFVIPTSEGIILIDAMWNGDDAKDVIVPGIEKLGLNPQDIKYVILTHEHVDHFGGARYLEDTYGSKTLMTKTAWEGLHDPNARVLIDPFGNKSSDAPIPKTYQEIKDKEVVKLGEVDIQILATPGHAPGGISMLIPTTDNGTPRLVAVWGGSGLPQSLKGNQDYLNSLNYYEAKAVKQNVVGQITDHPFSNKLLEKMETLRNRKEGEPNPIVQDTTHFKKYIDSTLRKKVLKKIAGFNKD